MPLITPVGIIFDIEITALDPLPSSGSLYAAYEGTRGTLDEIHTGTEIPGSGTTGPGVSFVAGSNTYNFGTLRWAISGGERPSFFRYNSTSHSYHDFETDTPGSSFYFAVGSSIQELAISTGMLGDQDIRWGITRPSFVIGGATIRIIIADSSQSTIVSNFVQGIGTPAAPAAPTLTAGDMEIAANWAEPDDFGSPITGYDLEYSTNNGGTYTEIDVGDVTTYDITSLTNGVAVLVRVRARNAVGDGEYGPTASETPAATDLTPVITNVANQTGIVGTLFSVTLPVAVSGDPPLTYTVTGRPAWLAFNATSRVLSGTPISAATFGLTYTVTDVDGDSDSDAFNLVTENPPLVIGDFVIPSGQLLANVAVFTAGRNSTNFIYKSDGTTVGTLEDGTLPGNITRIRDRGPNDFQLNDNPSAEDIEGVFHHWRRQ